MARITNRMQRAFIVPAAGGFGSLVVNPGATADVPGGQWDELKGKKIYRALLDGRYLTVNDTATLSADDLTNPESPKAPETELPEGVQLEVKEQEVVEVKTGKPAEVKVTKK